MYVETKTYGEAITSAPSLAGFAEWLDQQPADKAYTWRDPRVCPGAQYARAIGMEQSWNDQAARADEHWRTWRQIGMLAFLDGETRTFGALSARVRAELAVS